jgi:uroporphyrinogen decarboxylase
MADAMTKRERVMAAICGDDVDRVPFSFWYHFPGGENPDEDFIQAEVGFAVKYDVDLLKVMHDAPLDLPPGLEEITSAADLRRLEPVDPRKGNFARHLSALHAIRKRLPDDRPMVDTLFSPFSYCDKLTGKQALRYLDEDPDAFRHALWAIAESVAAYGVAAIEDGAINGMFLASSGGVRGFIDETVFREIVQPTHKHIGDACATVGTCNILHLHGTNLMWEPQCEIPAHIVNWSDRTTAPSLSEARRKDDRCLAGGINEVTAGDVTPEQIREQVRSAIEELRGRKMIAACGCAVPTEAPEANLLAIRDAVLGG